jgi:hypothetical protein
VVDGGLLGGSGCYRGVDDAWLGEAEMGAWSRSSIASSREKEARLKIDGAAVTFGRASALRFAAGLSDPRT